MFYDAKLLLPVVLAGVFTYFVPAERIKRIPFHIMMTRRRDLVVRPLEEFGNRKIEINNFQCSRALKLLLVTMASVICAAVLLVNGLSLETLGFSGLFLTIILLLGINIKHQLLPDSVVLPLIRLGLLFYAFWGHNLSLYLYGAVAAYCIPFVVFWCAKLYSGKESIGHGDFKMFAALGSWSGVHLVPSLAVLFLGTTLVSFAVMQSTKSHIPMGTGAIYLISALILHFYGSVI